MSKFNLEAAKRGETVQAMEDGKWVDVHFIGVGKNKNDVWIESDVKVAYVPIESHDIRMKPKQREMWFFPYKIFGDVYLSDLFESKQEADMRRREHVDFAGFSQMILVDEE